MKKLYRSKGNKMLAGVCGGLGEFIDVDPSIIRLLVVIAGFCTLGVVILLYIAASLILPQDPGYTDV